MSRDVKQNSHTSRPPVVIDRCFQFAYRLAYRLHLVWAFLFRPKCRGVWVAVWCGGEVLLIKNAYRCTLTLPGGGIDRGESAEEAAIRELREEVGILCCADNLSYRGQYLSRAEYKRDHIELFELELHESPQICLDNREVVWAEARKPDEALLLPLFPVLRTYLLEKSTDGSPVIGRSKS